jgi:hypothetical protein
MAVEYVNRKGQTYYLHESKTKTGRPRYHFSMKQEGKLAEAIPEGYEVYEHPNAQVFLRRVRPEVITDDEVATVERAMQRFYGLPYYQLDVRGDTLAVFLPNQDVERFSRLLNALPGRGASAVEPELSEFLTYSAELRFVLVDEQERAFKVQRYCYFGSVDDWIDIGGPGDLASLAERYVKHLGQGSLFELY